MLLTVQLCTLRNTADCFVSSIKQGDFATLSFFVCASVISKKICELIFVSDTILVNKVDSQNLCYREQPAGVVSKL